MRDPLPLPLDSKYHMFCFLIVTDVVFLINFDVNELTRSSISVSRCTEVVLDFNIYGFKPKVGNSLSFVNFVSKLVCLIKSPIA